MGGSSGGSTSSSTTQNQYNPTNYKNPYATVYTDKNGTTSQFNDNSWFGNINNYANANANQLLEEWRNPTLDSATNRAKINAYQKNLNEGALNSLENNIIAPLSQRNMIRSSQATNLYRGLNDSLTDNYNTFITNLLADSQKNTGTMIDQLTNWYMQGQNVLNQAEQNAINQASGNATSTTNSIGNSSAS